MDILDEHGIPEKAYDEHWAWFENSGQVHYHDTTYITEKGLCMCPVGASVEEEMRAETKVKYSNVVCEAVPDQYLDSHTHSDGGVYFRSAETRRPTPYTLIESRKS